MLSGGGDKKGKNTINIVENLTYGSEFVNSMLIFAIIFGNIWRPLTIMRDASESVDSCGAT